MVLSWVDVAEWQVKTICFVVEVMPHPQRIHPRPRGLAILRLSPPFFTSDSPDYLIDSPSTALLRVTLILAGTFDQQRLSFT